MKEVVRERNQEVVKLQDVDNNLFYATKTKRRGATGVILKGQYYGGKYKVFCYQGFTRGNGWDEGFDTLKECVKDAMHKHYVYEFDTFKEMCQWLADNTKDY